jgi:NADH:ubiquinone oxidoreductase subunit E
VKRFAQQGAENEATLKAVTQELSKYASGKGRSAVKKALAEVQSMSKPRIKPQQGDAVHALGI